MDKAPLYEWNLPIQTIEPTNGFILIVVKTLLEHKVRHTAILAAINAMEQTVINEGEHRAHIRSDEEHMEMLKKFNVFT